MNIDQARQVLAVSQRITFFTGSGVSAESGIPTFRDEGALWDKYDPGKFASIQGIVATAVLQPSILESFLIDFLEPIVLATPNAAHLAIAHLEDFKDVSVVTQNVDGLHQRGGSANVVELHGSIYQSKKVFSDQIRHLDTGDLQLIISRLGQLPQRRTNIIRVFRALAPLATIGASGIWLPNLVLFGQRLAPDVWNRAVDAIKHSDCLVVVGTSLSVYPAALLVQYAKHIGKHLIHIDPNIESDETVAGLAAEVVSEICRF